MAGGPAYTVTVYHADSTLADGIEIHPAAEIGEGFFADHGMGIVIGQTAILGKNVTLYHGVTLGGVMPAVDAKAQRSIKRHPTLRDEVIIGAGAQILGPVTVGARARVGGNSVVTKDVGDGQTVVGIPAKPIHKRPADGQFEPYAVSHMPSEDSQERTFVNFVCRARIFKDTNRIAKRWEACFAFAYFVV
ncbi:MAG: hypothetical protein CM15mP100_7780 [Alphaproteobacteria bacterium]|nr:MAG: hypothetical protein CM15mP100_7780 [Alphaproteobacteria bacterium]